VPIGIIGYRKEPITRWQGAQITAERHSYAIQLLQPGILPIMIAAAIDRARGTMPGFRPLDPEHDIRVDIQPFHPFAHNVPDMEVAVATNRGGNNELYDAREAIRMDLVRALLEWFGAHPSQTIQTFTVDIRLAGHMCGLRVELATGKVLRSWGGVVDPLPGTTIPIQ